MTDGYLITTKREVKKLLQMFKKAGENSQVKLRIEKTEFYWYLKDNGSCDDD